MFSGHSQAGTGKKFVSLDTGCILELLPNSGKCAVLFYPGTMLEPGHYSLLLNYLQGNGFNVAGLHLSGHGLCLKQKGFTFAKLLNQGLQAENWLRGNGYKVVVCGHSQGGILTLAHAAASENIEAAFALSALFPSMDRAIELTHFAPFARHRARILKYIQKAAQILPGLPIPMPFYFRAGRVLAGKKPPVCIGAGRGRITYPLCYIASLFSAKIPASSNCPFWLINARNDGLFNMQVIEETFAMINAPDKKLVWLENGGHLAPFNPGLASFIATTIACSCLNLGLELGSCHLL